MKKIRVLFVCSGPGVRVRIAEAFLARYERFEAHSAQFEEMEGRLPPFVLDLMEEVGITLPNSFPPTVFKRKRDKEAFDFVITLCHASKTVVCPNFRVHVDAMYKTHAQRISWMVSDFRDLKKYSPDERQSVARSIRDEIEQNIKELVETVMAEGAST